MSWECYCEGAVERGREHQPGSHIVCPFCGRTREHVELLSVVEAITTTLSSGSEVNNQVLGRAHEHVQRWRGPAEHQPTGFDAEKRRGIEVVPNFGTYSWDTPAAAAFRRAVMARDEPEQMGADRREPEPDEGVPIEIIVAEEPEELIEAGHRLWSCRGDTYHLMASDETKVVVRKGFNAPNSYVSRETFLRDYKPIR